MPETGCGIAYLLAEDLPEDFFADDFEPPLDFVLLDLEPLDLLPDDFVLLPDFFVEEDTPFFALDLVEPPFALDFVPVDFVPEDLVPEDLVDVDFEPPELLVAIRCLFSFLA